MARTVEKASMHGRWVMAGMLAAYFAFVSIDNQSTRMRDFWRFVGVDLSCRCPPAALLAVERGNEDLFTHEGRP